MAQPEYVSKEKEYQKAYYQKHREAKLAYAREQREQRGPEINARRRERTRARGVPPAVKTGIVADSAQEYNRKYHLEIKAAKNLKEKYTAFLMASKTGAVECGCCHEADIRVLTINHISGGGRAENSEYGLLRRRILRGDRATDDLEVLCFNCNIRYEYIRGRNRLPSDWETILQQLREAKHGLSKQ